MLRGVQRLFSSSRSIEQEKFTNIMSMARKVADDNPSGLYSLVRALLLPIQAEQMLAVSERRLHEAPPALDWDTFFFNIFSVVTLDELYRSDKPVVSVNLARDIVLTTPWHRYRYGSALANIGDGKPCGSWRQDSNHGLALCWPWNVAFVLGGNHSIAAGILAGEGGELTATDVYDFAPVLDRAYCDGNEYRTASGHFIASVDEARKAAVYEIGRLMIKHSLSN